MGKGGVRPYWHVDAKWIAGLLFTGFLVVSLTFWVVARLAAEEIAVPVATYIVASQFSREGLDDPKDIEKFRQQNKGSKAEWFYPLPGQNVSVSRQELETLTPRQLRLRIFEQVVRPIYRQARTEQTSKELGYLAYLNYETNQVMAQLFRLSLIPLLLTGGALVAFSHRYGRLISPAVPLLLVSAGPSLLLFLWQNTTPPEGAGGAWGLLPRELVGQVLAALAPAFYGLGGLGMMLIGVAVVVGIGVKVVHV